MVGIRLRGIPTFWVNSFRIIFVHYITQICAKSTYFPLFVEWHCFLQRNSAKWGVSSTMLLKIICAIAYGNTSKETKEWRQWQKLIICWIKKEEGDFLVESQWLIGCLFSTVWWALCQTSQPLKSSKSTDDVKELVSAFTWIY